MFDIDIFLHGVLYGGRRWPAVPRVGEDIWLYRIGSNDRFICVVKEVIWGTDLSQFVLRTGDSLKVTVFVEETP